MGLAVGRRTLGPPRPTNESAPSHMLILTHMERGWINVNFHAYGREDSLVLSSNAPLVINEVRWMMDQHLRSIHSFVPVFSSFTSGVIVWHSEVSWLLLG